MIDVVIKKLNESYIKCLCSPSIAAELRDYFTFEIPNAQYIISMMRKKGRTGFDGKIRLYNAMTGQLLYGLLPKVVEWCIENDYTFKIPDVLSDTEFSKIEGEEFIQFLNLPKDKQIRDFQLKALVEGARGHRRLFVSPTGSGKSMMIYILTRYFSGRTLVIVPTVNLIGQMEEHFKEYGYKDIIHKIHAGQDKYSDAMVTFSTWQSLKDMDEEYFEQFDVVFGDEAHGIEAKVIQAMFNRMTTIKYRFGFTATMRETKTNPLVLQGIFGKIVELEKTANLIQKGTLAGLDIKAIVLKYPKDECKLVSKMSYQEEIKYIITHKRRNNYIKNLTNGLDGSALLLFRRIEDQGDILYELFKNGKRKVFYIHGGVEGDERNEIRKIIETEKDCTILGSSGVFSTGNDVYNIFNILLCFPIKGSIKLKQSIGRGLRRNAEKQHLTVFDFIDDFTYNGKSNHAVNHFVDRAKIYNEEGFAYRMYPIDFKGKEVVN